MESHPYSYGTKLTGLILHLFFTVVLTIDYHPQKAKPLR